MSKPKACRNSSVEGFIVCRNYTPPTGFQPNLGTKLTIEKDVCPSITIPFRLCADTYDSDMSYDIQGNTTHIKAHAQPIDPPYKRALANKRKPHHQQPQQQQQQQQTQPQQR
jgi:tRNA (cytidine32/guanosine34-2'-O)-methyltransferase